MSKIRRMWDDWRAWRACRKAQLSVLIPEPEPKLNVFQTFRRHGFWGRLGLVVCTFIVYSWAVQGTFTANVLPPLTAFFHDLFHNGSFDHNTLGTALGNAGAVLLLTASSLYVWHAKGWWLKWGLIATTIGLWVVNVDNNCISQNEARTAHYDGPVQKAARIAAYDADMKAADEALKAVPPHAFASKDRLDAAKAELEAIKESAEAECKRSLISRGVVGDPRGPKCEDLEGQRKKQNDKVEGLITDYERTVQAEDARKAYWQAKAKKDAEGAAPDKETTDLAAGKTASPFWTLLVDAHVMGIDTAKDLTKDAPTIRGVVQEMLATFFAPVGVTLVWWFFGLLVCDNEEAEKRWNKVLDTVSEERAAQLQGEHPEVDAPAVAKVIEVEEIQPHAEALGLVEPEPAFVSHPASDEERVMAAIHKTAKAKRPKGARKKVEAHPSSVVQWHKERCFTAVGRMIWSTDAYPDYENWCIHHNQTAVEPRKFLKVLRDECGVQTAPTKGATKIFDIGIAAAHLRVVSG